MKVTALKHAKERLNERINSLLSIRSVIRAIKNKTIKRVANLPNSRILIYGKVDGCPVKVVFSTKNKKIITFLPFNYEYEFEFIAPDGNDVYRIIIYPDCYMVTGDKRRLTKFMAWDSLAEGWKMVALSDQFNFTTVFNAAWGHYNTQQRRR